MRWPGFTEARQDHGASEPLDEVVATGRRPTASRPTRRRRCTSAACSDLRSAVALVTAKATPAELGDYRLFVVSLAKRVAAAKKEKGSEDGVSPAEAVSIGEIDRLLGRPHSPDVL